MTFGHSGLFSLLDRYIVMKAPNNGLLLKFVYVVRFENLACGHMKPESVIEEGSST